MNLGNELGMFNLVLFHSLLEASYSVKGSTGADPSWVESRGCPAVGLDSGVQYWGATVSMQPEPFSPVPA